MFIFLFIVAVAVIYVHSFKEDFTKEKIQVIEYALCVIGAIILIYAWLSSITRV